MSAKRPGFTLVELLIIVLVVGVLAAITMPKFAAAKDKAYTSAMKSDLRNFANYEEDHASAKGGYFSGVGSAQGFSASRDPHYVCPTEFCNGPAAPLTVRPVTLQPSCAL